VFANWLKKIAIVVMELAVIAGLLSFVYKQKGFENAGQVIPALQNLAQQAVGEPQKELKIFPALAQETTRTFNWEYKGEKYSLNQTLYQSAYDYYKAEPKIFSYSGELNKDWENQYYGMFLKTAENDKSISELATALTELGKKHKLNDDQIVDLTLAFVQSITYDDAKAKNILAKTASETMLYPYETLFEQAGVCSDKSLLAISLLKEMGYGTAIFAYEADNHMAIGIACPQSYSTYGSGYCYAETTSSGNKIGIIPTFDSESNKAVDVSSLPNLDSTQAQNAKIGQLGQVTIYQKTTGREYSGIIQTEKISQEIELLNKKIETSFAELQALKKKIAASDKKLNEMKVELDKMYSNNLDIEKYNALVKKYNDFFENYKKDVKKYNNDIELYNKTIQRYNILIKQ
jgi:hypothetical protein